MNEKVIIVEDEGVATRRLEKMLRIEQLNVIGHFTSNELFTNFLLANKEPDLYFLDIHLSDGIVFDVLKNHTLNAPIIFTTAYDQYAIRAFKQKSIDYLMKPINADELKRAIEEFRDRTSLTQNIDISALSSIILKSKESNTKYRERISVKIGDKIKSIPIDKISHFYSANKTTYIHTTEGRSYPIEHTVEQINKELDPAYFYRVSRSHIVCIKHIENVIAYSNSRLKVAINNVKDQEIIVARDRVKDFKNWLG